MGLPPKGDSLNRAGAYFANLKVHATATPSMKVKVTEGSFWHDGITFVEYSGGTSPTITASSSAAKWVVVVIDKRANVLLVNGLESANPVVPAIPEGHVPLAIVYVDGGVTAIYDDAIFDARPFIGASVFSSLHNGMKGRDDLNCHPIDAITDLSQALTDRPTMTGLATELANKSDVDGTTSPTFTLNKDLTGVANSDCRIEIERGTEQNVSLTWKETAEQWQIDQDLFVRSNTPSQVQSGIILTSPNGTNFKITVEDDGTLKTTQL
jgi:hypothetical protein